ncbi:MAG: phosphoglycerate dehydrogenase [Christensenellales bacterium]|jgi:D-3-phosphoglycerate dehydrogenase
MKILVTPTSFLKPVNAKAKEMLEAFADEVVYNPHARPLTAEEVAALLPGVDGYIAGLDTISAEVLADAPASLKVISRYGAGVDRVDLAAARARGIVVTNTPGTNSTAVCELAFGLMLSLARHIPQLDAAVKSGGWPRTSGMELAGRTLGIVGCGAIGKKLAVRAKAFEMDVIAYDPCFDAAFAAEHGIRQVTLEELISRSDVISLHVPLTEQTRHMIGAAQIAAMKPGALIINTARGGLIDEAAAAEALKSGKLGGVGLDAFEVEPPQDSPLMGLDNVVMTPHAGAHTNEAVAAMGRMAVQNLIDVLQGKECRYVVN